jgi:hypothetical protein
MNIVINQLVNFAQFILLEYPRKYFDNRYMVIVLREEDFYAFSALWTDCLDQIGIMGSIECRPDRLPSLRMNLYFLYLRFFQKTCWSLATDTILFSLLNI